MSAHTQIFMGGTDYSGLSGTQIADHVMGMHRERMENAQRERERQWEQMLLERERDLETPTTPGAIDWAEVKRIQDEEFPDMEHLDPCICTQGPGGVIIDYDCGRNIGRRRSRA
jgi:hypothetical protein